uniref:Putative ovule protein n=1 Tax=Solanum chacoense TaxID=4108 RepID=A0A0V0H9S1_SOLCH
MLIDRSGVWRLQESRVGLFTVKSYHERLLRRFICFENDNMSFFYTDIRMAHLKCGATHNYKMSA